MTVSKGSQIGIRVTLTGVVVLVSLLLLLPLVLFKVLEGTYLAASFTKDWLFQVWGPSPPTRVGKRDQDAV